MIPVRAVAWWWSKSVRPASRSPKPSSNDDPGLDLEATPLAAVIWCTGYRSDFRWIDGPVFDGSGLGHAEAPFRWRQWLPALHRSPW